MIRIWSDRAVYEKMYGNNILVSADVLPNLPLQSLLFQEKEGVFLSTDHYECSNLKQVTMGPTEPPATYSVIA